MSDELSDLQTAIKSALDADNFFSDATAGAAAKPITVITEDVMDVESRIAETVGRTKGIMVLVYSPGGKVKDADAFSITFSPATVVCRVFEKPTLNRADTGTQQPGRRVAIAVAKVLNGRTLPGFNGPIVCVEVWPGRDPRFQTHDVFFQLTVPLSETAPTRS